MGVPVKAEIEMNKNPNPIRIPISWNPLAVAISAGDMSETNAPWKKPNKMVTTIKPPEEAAPNTAKIKIPAPVVMIANRFKGPNLSARKLGEIRPNTEAALSIARV